MVKYEILFSEYLEDYIDFIYSLLETKPLIVIETEGVCIWDNYNKNNYILDIIIYDDKYAYYLKIKDQEYTVDDVPIKQLITDKNLLKLKEHNNELSKISTK